MYEDMQGVLLSEGDIVTKSNKKYIVRFIEEYIMATEAIVEDYETHQVFTFLLRDLKKI
jgi:hypothetical protein